jgi:hypothetical protein
MKDFDIDNYLEEMIVAIDDLGGCVNLSLQSDQKAGAPI